MKFCKDCKHYRAGEIKTLPTHLGVLSYNSPAACNSPRLVAVCPVTGKVTPANPYVARGDAGMCQGLHWEAA